MQQTAQLNKCLQYQDLILIFQNVCCINASNTATTLDTSSSKFTNISNVIYDEIRLWNKALSIEQIVSNMYNQVFSNPDLSAYWSCDVNSISNGVFQI